MKILIIRLSAIGDVVHCLPIAAQIKRRIPGAEITWLVEEKFSELIVNNPCVDRAMIFPGKRWRHQIKNVKNWMSTTYEAKQFLSELRAQNYDIAIETQGLLKSALLAYASGAKIRLGFKNTRECADQLLTHRADIGDYFGHNRHIVELNLCLAEYLFNLLGLSNSLQPAEFPLPPCPAGSIAKIDQISDPLTKFPMPPGAELISDTALAPPPASIPMLKERTGLSTLEVVPLMLSEQNEKSSYSESIPAAAAELSSYCRRVVRTAVLIPGTTWSSKIWPEQKWCELAVTLGKRLQSNIVLVGSAGELEVSQHIAKTFQQACPQLKVVNLATKTTLLDLVALFQRCELVVGADTGPLHIAAAVGFPAVIGIYGSTPWRRNGPYGKKCRSVALDLECQPCFSKTCRFSTVACLRDLTTETVFKEIIVALTDRKTAQNTFAK